MTIEEEIDQLGEMRHIGLALLQFSRALFKGEFKKRITEWVYDPNFVAFEVRFKRVKHLNILLRSIKTSPEQLKVLPLYGGHLTYDRAEIRSPRQLGIACAYIEASWRDWYVKVLREDPKM